ncbi:hypothetical protein [Rhizobium sp. L51/94]|uniref:hypothetical protein n=1 Tax=Rhizobium sp. L51/94 TaxID=2819999 RepID=UPI001C5A8E88|nr:hypothetical protein [Rhizobium sp. L51/94]QXZ79663.1 hypothetical protein J5274_06685 [Rhizobium sp. L51/94]
MSSPATYDSFHDRLVDAWTATPLRFENEDCQDLIDSNVEAFVYVEIYGDTYNQESVGAPGENMFLEQGVTYMHVMVPSMQGSRQARVYANQLLNLFREQPIGQLFMPQLSIGAGDPGGNFPNYFSIAATITWYRRDITNLG